MLIDWFTVAAQLLNFLVLVWLMKRFLYQPILAAIAARDKLIATELADAAARQGAAQQLGADFTAKSTAFDQQRAALLGAATAEALATKAALLQQGQAAAAAQSARQREQMLAEQERLCATVTRQAQEAVLAALRQALADLGDEPLEAAMVRTFVRRLGQLDAASRAGLAAALAADPGVAEVHSAFALDPAQQSALGMALQGAGIAPQALRFGIAANMLCGIELRLKGWSLAWNLDQYLRDFAERSGALLKAGTGPGAA